MNAARLQHYLRFLIAGGLNTLFGFAIYSAFIFIGLPVLLALAIATLLGALFNFFSYKKIAFNNAGSGMLHVFLAVYAVILLANAVLLLALRAQVAAFLESGLTSPLVDITAQLISLLVIVPLSYILLKKFVYGGKVASTLPELPERADSKNR